MSNTVILVGRLAKDTTIKKSQVSSFLHNVLLMEPENREDCMDIEQSLDIDLVFKGDLTAISLELYTGMRVLIEGSLAEKNWAILEDEVRLKHYINVRVVVILDDESKPLLSLESTGSTVKHPSVYKCLEFEKMDENGVLYHDRGVDSDEDWDNMRKRFGL